MLAIMTVPTGKLRILPTEHGVWGLLAGAALVGLLLSHNLAGLGLLVAVLAAVIARQGVVGWRQAPRSAAGVVGMAGLVGMGGILVTWLFAPTTAWLPWAVAMAIVGGVQLLWMWLRPGRPWLVSAVGGLAFAMLAAAVAAAGEALVSSSVLAAVVLAGHFLVMVPLVRAQTRRNPAGPSWRSTCISSFSWLLWRPGPCTWFTWLFRPCSPWDLHAPCLWWIRRSICQQQGRSALECRRWPGCWWSLQPSL